MIVYLAMSFYFVRALIIGIAVGVMFIRCNLFSRMNNLRVMYVGICASPLFVSLFDYLLGLVPVGWNSRVFVMIPLVLSCVWIVFFGNYKIVCEVLKDFIGIVKQVYDSLGKWFTFDVFVSAFVLLIFTLLYYSERESFNYLLSLYHTFGGLGYVVVLAFLIVLTFALVKVIKELVETGNIKKHMLIILFISSVFCNLFHGLAINDSPFYNTDRSHYELDARYFVEDKNSWIIDNYSGERYGSSLMDDHGPLWIMCIADSDMVADAFNLGYSLKLSNLGMYWVAICFYTLLFITATQIASSYIAGFLAMVLFDQYEETISMVRGSRDAFRLIGMLVLILYVAEVYLRVSEDKIKWHHYCFLGLFCFLCMNGHESNAYILLAMFVVLGIMMLIKKVKTGRVICVGVAVFIGTLLGIAKTIMIYTKTGQLASGTGAAFHDTPVVAQTAAVNAARVEWPTILASYSFMMLLMIAVGLIGLIYMIVSARKGKDNYLFIISMLILGMLLPLTGIMDWMGYECSINFIEQYRYRLYFLMLFAMTGAWLLTRPNESKVLKKVTLILTAVFVVSYTYVGYEKVEGYGRGFIDRLKEIAEDKEELAILAESVTDGDVFAESQNLLFFLHGTPKLLFHMYSEDLIQAKSDDEIEAALDKLNVGAILLPPSGCDYHDYSLLPFWKYINDEENFTQITQEDRDDDVPETLFVYNKRKTSDI